MSAIGRTVPAARRGYRILRKIVKAEVKTKQRSNRAPPFGRRKLTAAPNEIARRFAELRGRARVIAAAAELASSAEIEKLQRDYVALAVDAAARAGGLSEVARQSIARMGDLVSEIAAGGNGRKPA